MTFQELIDDARVSHLDDAVEPYLWSDEQLLRFAGEAERQACRRGACTLIFDDSMTITLVADQASYSLDPAILRLERVLWTSTAGVALVEKTSERSLDNRELPEWRRAEAGPPSRYYVRGRMLFLDRVPTDADVTQDATLNLQVWREPVFEADVSSEPELQSQHHDALTHWIAYRALMIPDHEGVNKDIAAMHLGLFDQHFGKPLSASDIEYQIASTGDTQHLAAIPYRDHHRRSTSSWVRELG